jgi:hypothetical protein
MAVSKIKTRERSEIKGAFVPRKPGPLRNSFMDSPDIIQQFIL